MRGVPRLRRASSHSAVSSASSFSSLALALQDLVQRLGRVELDVLADAEPAAHRAGEQADAGRRADQRERLAAGIVIVRACMPCVERDVDLEVLHRRVEVLLDDGGQAVDLVDEQDVAAVELGEDADQVRALGQGGAVGDVDLRADLVGDDVGERGLAQARRAVEQRVLDRLLARFGRPRPRSCSLRMSVSWPMYWSNVCGRSA